MELVSILNKNRNKFCGAFWRKVALSEEYRFIINLIDLLGRMKELQDSATTKSFEMIRGSLYCFYQALLQVFCRNIFLNPNIRQQENY